MYQKIQLDLKIVILLTCLIQKTNKLRNLLL